MLQVTNSRFLYPLSTCKVLQLKEHLKPITTKYRIKLAPRSDTFLWAGALLKPTITNFLLKLVTIAPVTGMLCWLLQVWSSGTALDLFPLLTQVVKISQTPHFSDHFQFYFKNLIWLLWAVISFSPKLNLGLIRFLFKHTQKWQLSTNILTPDTSRLH